MFATSYIHSIPCKLQLYQQSTQLKLNLLSLLEKFCYSGSQLNQTKSLSISTKSESF